MILIPSYNMSVFIIYLYIVNLRKNLAWGWVGSEKSEVVNLQNTNRDNYNNRGHWMDLLWYRFT